MTLEGAADRAAFHVFAAHVLGPTRPPGQLVIGDNLGGYKSVTAARLLAARDSRVLLLPPSSPDVAPIEQAFGKLPQTQDRPAAHRRAHPRGLGGGRRRRRPSPVRPLRLPHPGPMDIN